MNYLETQRRLLTDTYFLLLLFVLCAAGMMLFSTIIFYFVYMFIYRMFETGYYDTMPENIWRVLIIFNLIIMIFMSVAFWARMTLLSSGGAKIAEYCGAVEVTTQDQDYYSQRYLDVVHEMAIACSVPVPRTFLLKNCDSINAFAAGFTPEDAAITITKGAMEQLNRDELQAIVAHEFSHIVHQDMQLNMRLLAFQSSINAFLELTWILDTERYDNVTNYIFLPLAPLVIVMLPFGVVGSIFSALLKLGVNRRREFLADASAVRYTRYAPGLLGALKKIGSIPVGKAFEDGSLQFVSHMMFDGKSVLSGMIASHPPVITRIQKYDPAFTNAKLIMLQLQYQDKLPDGKEEDCKLGYCPDGVNYVRDPNHVNANIDNLKSSEYLEQLQKIHNQSQPGDNMNRIVWSGIIILITLLMIIAGRFLYYSIYPAPTLPPGITINIDPQVTEISDVPPFTVDNFLITPIATISLQGRVIVKEVYKNDVFSAISNVELILGWGVMSDSTNLSKMHFGLTDRVYIYSYRYDMALRREEISSHMAHTMIIAANSEVAKVISKIHIDSLIQLSGYIVNLQLPSRKSKSSTLWDQGRVYTIPDWILYLDSAEIIDTK